MTMTIEQVQTRSPVNLAGRGAVAGLAGGLLFGLMMYMGGMLPMVGMLVRQENSLVGFIVHMVISVVLGAIYGIIAGRRSLAITSGVIGGLIYGVVWWILGALILMPLLLGMTQMVLVIGGAQWMSLIGHLLYGLVTGLIFVPLARRE